MVEALGNGSHLGQAVSRCTVKPFESQEGEGVSKSRVDVNDVNGRRVGVHASVFNFAFHRHIKALRVLGRVM